MVTETRTQPMTADFARTALAEYAERSRALPANQLDDEALSAVGEELIAALREELPGKQAQRTDRPDHEEPRAEKADDGARANKK